MPAPYYRDALFIGLGGAGALIGLQTLLHDDLAALATAHRSTETSFGSNFDAFIPAASILGTSTAAQLTVHRRRRVNRLLRRGDASCPLDARSDLLTGDAGTDARQLGQPGGFRQTMAGRVDLAWRPGFRCALRDAIQHPWLLSGNGHHRSSDAMQPNCWVNPIAFYRLNGYAVVLALLLLLASPLLAWRSSSAPDKMAIK